MKKLVKQFLVELICGKKQSQVEQEELPLEL